MITSLLIKDVASYDANDGVEIDDLKKVNFFFGFNGTGKSTIAKYLRSLEPNVQQSKFNACNNVGYNSNNYEILTFNKDFIKENFIQNEELKGVFSLNQSNADIDQKISEKETFVQYLEEEKEKYQRTIESVDSDEDSKYEALLTHCWNQRSEFSSFSKLNLEHSGSRPNHLQKIRDLLDGSGTHSLTIEELNRKYQDIYEKDLKKIPYEINARTYFKIRRLEKSIETLLQEVIVGNEDVDIANLINSLGSKKWVEQGLVFLEDSGTTCPFCQHETIDENLLEQFEDLFDESYKNKLTEIRRLKDQYSNETSSFIEQLSNIQDYYNPSNQVSNSILRIKSILEDNLETINDKLDKANRKKTIDSICILKSKLSSIQKGIEENNQLLEDIDEKKEALDDQVWKYMAYKCKHELESFDNRKNKYDRIRGLATTLKQRTNSKIKTTLQNIEALRKQTVNTKEAVDNINTILKNSGFEGFEIDEKDKQNNISRYYLKRPNESISESVFKTLSEGEKNLIAILYFYQLCLGTDNLQSNSNKKKIIVIDDPVSSLDSQVLFLISTLIRELIKRKANSSKPERKQFFNDNIEQVFIFTHNFYFYKEVSFGRRLICTDYYHYKVNKISNKTEIIGDYNSRIKDDYSLLWSTLKDIKSNNLTSKNNNVVIANTMRRIIETYVNFIGLKGGSWSSIVNANQEDPNYYIKSAFISKINDDSHKVAALNSLYYQKISTEQPQVLFDVFKDIFKAIGKKHYEMMMDEEID